MRGRGWVKKNGVLVAEGANTWSDSGVDHMFDRVFGGEVLASNRAYALVPFGKAYGGSFYNIDIANVTDANFGFVYRSGWLTASAQVVGTGNAASGTYLFENGVLATITATDIQEIENDVMATTATIRGMLFGLWSTTSPGFNSAPEVAIARINFSPTITASASDTFELTYELDFS